jgi:quinol-cytochrome oxidoreductase complex cytochrome b subunit
MLRSIPSKIGGVVVLFISIFILFLMPFLSVHKLKPSFAAVLESIFSLPIYLWEPELILGIDVPRPYEKYSF